MRRFNIKALFILLSACLLLIGCSPPYEEVKPSEEEESVAITPLEYNPSVFWEYNNAILKITGSGPQLGGSGGTGFEYRYTVARNAISVIVEGEITYISAYGFANFDKLQSVEINSPALCEVGVGLFAFDKELLTVDVRNTCLFKISTEMFVGCSNLKSVELPGSVTGIDSLAFQGCTSLETITFDGTISQWNSIELNNSAFEDCAEISVICTDGDTTVKGGMS